MRTTYTNDSIFSWQTGPLAAALLLASPAHGWQVALYREDEYETTAVEPLAGENDQNTECHEVSSSIVRSLEVEDLGRWTRLIMRAIPHQGRIHSSASSPSLSLSFTQKNHQPRLTQAGPQG
ncbi:hypothetical protein DL767_004932 [Monosporascus sp. MG133]|nr:hypothetical protein DL767_004932 [Monosporascus sp. MG133]